MQRIQRLLRIAGAAALGAACSALVAPTPAGAQEQGQELQCQLEGSPGAQAASEKLTEARNAAEGDATQAAYMAAFDAVRANMDSNPTAAFLAANAAIGLGNYEEADRLLDYFIQEKPECATEAANARYNGWVTLYNEAIHAYQGGDNARALERFELANMFHPDLRSFNNAALLHIEMGNTEEAIATYNAALEADVEGEAEQRRQIIAGLGDLLTTEGRPEEAAAAYESYLADHPDDALVRIRYALSLMDTGQTEEATAIFEEILGRDDLTAQQWVEVGVGLYNTDNFADAATAFSKARERNPYNKEAMENLVNASVQAGRTAPVLPLADTLVSWYPHEQAHYQLLASALARADDDMRAMQVLQTGENLSVVFDFVQMGEAREGSYVVRGSVEARAGAPESIEVPFEFLGADGSVVATETLTLSLPAAGESGRFDLTVNSDTPIAGFRYGKGGA